MVDAWRRRWAEARQGGGDCSAYDRPYLRFANSVRISGK
jgi:hypothetical protein